MASESITNMSKNNSFNCKYKSSKKRDTNRRLGQFKTLNKDKWSCLYIRLNYGRTNEKTQKKLHLRDGRKVKIWFHS